MLTPLVITPDFENVPLMQAEYIAYRLSIANKTIKQITSLLELLDQCLDFSKPLLASTWKDRKQT